MELAKDEAVVLGEADARALCGRSLVNVKLELGSCGGLSVCFFGSQPSTSKGCRLVSAMPFLRQRKHVDVPSATLEGVKSEDGEEVRLVSVSRLEAVKKRGRKRRQGLVFILGGLFGLMLAAFLADRNDMIHLSSLPDLVDLKLESLAGVLPAGLLKDAKDLLVGRPPSTVADTVADIIRR